MGFIAMADPASKATYTILDVATAHDAIKAGYIPLNPSGAPALVQEFEGGYLVDGAPLNVHLEGVWYAGQKELLQPYWEKGSIPRPVIDATVVPMPPAVRTNWESNRPVADVAADWLGSPWLIYIALGLGAFLLFRK